MGTGNFVVLVGAAVLVAPPAGVAAAPAAASGATSVAAPAAVQLSRCYPPDNGNPVLKTFTITPANVDARSGRQVVTFKATPEDTGGPGSPSGVARGRMSLGFSPNPDNAQGSWRMHWNGYGALVLRFPFVPQDRAGNWYVSLRLEDAVGNATQYAARDLAAAGLPSTFTTQTTAAFDRDRPTLRSVHLSTTTVDVGRHRAEVAIRVRAADDSGVAGVSAWMYGSNFSTTRVAYLRLRKGSPTNGQWRGHIVVPRLAGNDTAKLIVDAWDYRGRYRKYLPKRLAEIGAVNQVRVLGHVDSQRPRPRTPTVAPTAVDLRTGARKVTVRVRVTDRGAGVREVLLTFSGSANRLEHQDYDLRMVRVSGTPHNGIWKATVTLPPCEAEAGKWSAYVSAFDYGLPGKGADSPRVTVTNDDIAPPSAEVIGRVPVKGPLTIKFDEDVVGVTPENTLVHVGVSVADRPGAGPTPNTGAWACRDAGGAAVDCTTGPVRTAAFTPTTPFRADANHTLLLNPEHHRGLTDLAGNPPVDLFTDMIFLWNDLSFTPH